MKQGLWTWVIKAIVNVILVNLIFIQNAWATLITAPIQTLDNNIEIQVFSYKKTRHYTAVELGFSNPLSQYVDFTPTEIYLDDEVKYSLPPLSTAEVQRIEEMKPSLAFVPAMIGVGLGIATLGTGIYGQSNVSKGLGIAALSMGGVYLLSKNLENYSQQNRLIGFEGNRLGTINKLPPHMVLGGFLYFPSTKKPKSITIVARNKNGQYEKKTFDLTQVKESRMKRLRKDR